MALPDDALIDLEEARSFLQKDSEETEQDDIIEGLIVASSAEITRHTRREFAPKGEAPQERDFLFPGGGQLVDLEPYDVRSVQAVTLGADLPSPVPLEAAQWSLRPITSPEGVYQSIRLRNLGGVDLGLPEDDSSCVLRVKGIWGFPAVPENVKHWCKVTVAIWLRKDVAAFSRTLQLDNDRVEAPEELPTAVIRGLRKYRRRAPLLPR